MLFRSQTDNPPFGVPREDGAVWTWWAQAIPRAQVGVKLVPIPDVVAGDNPPFGIRSDGGVWAWWKIPDRTQQPGVLSPGIPGQSVDPPPPREAPVGIQWLWWLPAPPRPPALPPLVPIPVVVAGDNPPFGIPRYDGLIAGVWAAQAAIPRPYFPPPVLVVDGSITVDNPPPRVQQPFLNILKGWQPVGGHPGAAVFGHSHLHRLTTMGVGR